MQGHGPSSPDTGRSSSSSLYRTTTQFDPDGNPQHFENDGDFRQFIASAYIECGLTKRDSLVMSVPGEFLDFRSSDKNLNGASLGDVEVAWKHRLSPIKSQWAVSGQLLVMFPGYAANQTPVPSNHQEDVEGRLLIGRGASLAKQHVFMDVEAAYRYRNGAPADQFRSDGTVGIEFGHRLMAMGQVFAIKGMQNGQPFTITNPNAQSDFDLYKVQPSLVLSLFHGTSLQAGWNDAFAGRNTGNGQTYILGLWKTF